MSVVGLDLSLTATGVAWADGSTQLLKANAKGMTRLGWIRDELLDVLEGVGPLGDSRSLVTLEGYSFGSRNSQAHALGELGGVIRLALWESGIAYIDVPPASLKKFATGRGNANKELMLVSAVRRLGYEGSDNNEADALWLRALGLHLLDTPIVDLPQTHIEALSKIEWPVAA